MNKIVWDRETGGVLLDTKVTKDTLGISPRPVFFEELDLLDLSNLGWTYPRCKEPIMWAINKQYWYRGTLLFEVKGANIYDAPTVILAPGIQPMTLEAVDVAEMLRRNSDRMFLLESEAIAFIRDIYDTYSGVNRARTVARANEEVDYEALAQRLETKTKQKMAVVKEDCDSFDIVPLDTATQEGKRVLLATKIDRFIASFSGGKDSQVVLDLCTRAIPPSAFEVIYSDTGYELPPSLELYEQVKQYYGERFPALKFSITRNHESVLNYWDRIGTPSDTHRWCCSVMKTAPLYRSLKVEGNKQARVLAFEGVRAEESTRRSNYDRIGKGVKHSTVINASPILFWNSVEVFLYLLKYQLPINLAYRIGITRAGCAICPYSSEWNDMAVNRYFPKTMAPFLSRIEEKVYKLSIPDHKEYIASGKWKLRAGGRDMVPDSSLSIISLKPDLVVEIMNPHKTFTTWFPAVGVFSGSSSTGQILYKGNSYSYQSKKIGSKFVITFHSASNDPLFISLVKRALYKAVFCINCEACEVECPTGALSIIPKAAIETSKCVHCHKCLNFHEMGCIVAHSLKVTNTNNKMKLVGYNNFGLRLEWFDFFACNFSTFFKNDDHGLNAKEQLPSFIKWLVHAGILNDAKNKQLTELGKLLLHIYQNNPSLVWEIIWINLTYSSPIIKWYSQAVPFSKEIEDNQLRALAKNDFPESSDTTIKNIVYAMLRTLKESPIGKDLGQYVSTDKQKFIRYPASDISLEAFAYTLYRYGEYSDTQELRVSTIYADNEKGPKVELGIERNTFLKLLRTLHNEGIIIAELNMGLDHIYLKSELDPISVLKKLAE